MANINISVDEILHKISNGEKLVFEPTGLLASKGGFLELSASGFRIVQGKLGIKSEQTYEWSDIKEFGVNKLQNTGKLSLFLKYDYNVMVAFNLNDSRQKKIHKFGSGMGKFMKYIGQGQQQYMHGAFQDNYGFKPNELAELLNRCMYNFSK